MRIAIKNTNGLFRMETPCHSNAMFYMAHTTTFTAEMVINYLTEYKPDLWCTVDVDINKKLIYPDTNFLCLLLNVYRFREWTLEDRLRVIKTVFELYPDTDVNHVNGYGSTAVMYALQLADLDIIRFLVSKGARFLKDGRVIRNNVYKDSDNKEEVDLQFCINWNAERAAEVQKLVSECIYNEVCGL